MRGLLNEAHDLTGHLQALLRVVGDPQLVEQVGKSHDAQADLAVAAHHLRDFRKRVSGHIDGVVEESHRPGDGVFQGRIIDRRAGVAGGHELGQVDGSEVAGLHRQQRLFAAVVDHESVRVEAVCARDLNIKDRFLAIGHQCDKFGQETLTVQRALIARQEGPKPGRLVVFAKVDQLLEAQKIVSGDDQFVLGFGCIDAASALAVREKGFAGIAPVFVDDRGDAQAQEHALSGLQGGQIALGKPNADAFGLGALDRAVAVEKASEKPTVKLA